MFYYIPFQYTALNEPTTRQINANLIIDLPQTTLADAQRNLFVRDLVRFAYIRHCYLQNNAYLQKPESVLQVYNGEMPSNLPQIRVVYQYVPNSDNWFEFVFYIHLDNGGTTTFLPFKQIEFTCRSEYDVYYEAFKSDLLTCGIPMQLPQYEEGNLVKVCYGAVYELAVVEKDASGQLVAVPVRNSQSSISINAQTNSCIHGFNLTNVIMNIIGASWQTANYGLGGWYELILANAQQSASIALHIIRREHRSYLVVDDDITKEYYRLEEFYSFDDLQRLVHKEYGLKYKPTTKTLLKLDDYIKEIHSEALLLMDLPDYIETFAAGTDVELIIAAIAHKYQINYNMAQYYYCVCQMER